MRLRSLQFKGLEVLNSVEACQTALDIGEECGSAVWTVSNKDDNLLVGWFNQLVVFVFVFVKL